MRLLLVGLLSLACSGCLSAPIKQADGTLERRIDQLESSVDRVAEDAIAKSEAAAAKLIEEAAETFGEKSKEVIEDAADELDEVLEKRIEQVSVAVDEKLERLSETTKMLIEESLPQAVENSVDKFFDKVRGSSPAVPNSGGPLSGFEWATILIGLFTGGKTARRMAKNGEDKKNMKNEVKAEVLQEMKNG